MSLSLSVETGGGALCYTSKQVNVTSQTGYLSSDITSDSGFGSDSCPWVIRVDAGQRINITLLDFTLAVTKLTGENEVKIKITNMPVKLCDNRFSGLLN